jgi:hypothetical protein
MTEKEKANAYDEVLKKVKDLISRCKNDIDRRTMIYRVEDIESILSELADSEDEKIRKQLIEWFSLPQKEYVAGFERKKVLAWLEKQGERPHAELGQSEVTKISDQEPKFHEGDWIISNDKMATYQVIEVKRGVYVIRDNADNHEYHIDIEACEKSGRLWTIQDAKDGDVLCTYECDEPKIVFILKGAPKKHYALSYHCYYNIMYPYFDSDSENGCLAPNDEDVKPATKEQRDLLFQKMADAGYEWDAEKKELKKIESKKLDTDKVIAWLVANIIDFEYYVKLFKQDFGL